ncbi:MAG: sulfatase-like hydrolase/transferase [Verrucomicrobia bacterium]|jgi:arylsulfatase A-like enzyme|nr:sulfatase-like hydrolase/transferase [Verrucomicrobiota bacterium]
MKTFTLCLLTLFSVLLLAPPTTLRAADVPAKKPNIVFIYSDDQPLRAMGSVDPFFSTPNIDRLAKESVVFDNAFVTTAICAVSRASFFTGQHSLRHGIASFEKPLSSAQIKQTYSGLLRQAGYRTAFLGKYAIGTPETAPRQLCLPKDQFDLWYGFPQALSYSQIVDGKKRYVTSVMEEKAISFLRENPPDQPFLLILALPEPHGQSGPWNYRDPDFQLAPPPGPPRRPKTMNQSALDRLPPAIRQSRNDTGFKAYEAGYEKYMATVRDYTARTDLAVGRVLQALKDLKLETNTVVIFTSDNGSMWGAHGLSGKWNMYEESIRVPLMIRDPRLSASARGQRSQMALNIDIAPTIVALAGLSVPSAMQGINLLPILSDPKLPTRADWYYEHDVGTKSQGKPLPRCEGVRTERWKYIRYKDTKPLQEELFDLHNDPLEDHNLAKEKTHAATLAKMSARCDELRKALR